MTAVGVGPPTRLRPYSHPLQQQRTLKRLEHERQRALQRKMFEDQMRALEHIQAQELLTFADPGLSL